jgi:4-hydroxybenzoate polyprenyltransferase
VRNVDWRGPATGVASMKAVPLLVIRLDIRPALSGSARSSARSPFRECDFGDTSWEFDLSVQRENEDMSKIMPVRTLGISRSAVLVPVGLSFLEARPVVQGVFALRFTVGGLLPSTGSHMLIGQGLIGQVAWLAAVWFIYLANGLSDIAGDQLNKSGRPLASGRLMASDARTIVLVLALVSCLAACLVNWIFLVLTGLMLTLGLCYSMGRFAAKRWSVSSSVVVGSAGFMTYVSGATAYSGSVSTDVVVYALILSLWMLVAGNYKDFGGEHGDKATGRRSLPILLGRRRAGLLIWAACLPLTIGAVVVSESEPRLWGLILLIPAVAVMAISWASSAQWFIRVPYIAFMVSQYLINAVTSVVWAGSWRHG